MTETEAKEAQREALRSFWSHQKQVKQKVITDLLRDLKRLGLNPRYSRRANKAIKDTSKPESSSNNSSADISHLLSSTLSFSSWDEMLYLLANPLLSSSQIVTENDDAEKGSES